MAAMVAASSSIADRTSGWRAARFHSNLYLDFIDRRPSRQDGPSPGPADAHVEPFVGRVEDQHPVVGLAGTPDDVGIGGRAGLRRDPRMRPEGSVPVERRTAPSAPRYSRFWAIRPPATSRRVSPMMARVIRLVSPARRTSVPT